MKGPEEKYEDQAIWNQEQFLEDREILSRDDINALKADEAYDDR